MSGLRRYKVTQRALLKALAGGAALSHSRERYGFVLSEDEGERMVRYDTVAPLIDGGLLQPSPTSDYLMLTPHARAATLLAFGLETEVTLNGSTYRLEPVLSRLRNPEHAWRVKRRWGLGAEVLVERLGDGRERNHWRWML